MKIVEIGNLTKQQKDGDGFVTVSKRKSARKSKITHQQIVIEGTDSNPGICSTASIRNILNSRKEIQTSDFFKNFLAVLIQSSDKINKPIADIVCFGIGCISSSKISQYQLALLLNLSENFECSIEVYDPIFTEVDKQILVDLKLNLLPSNCEGKKKQNSAGATLFFLPHCPRELSNNLLYANWDSGLLQNCIIYANSFEKVQNIVKESMVANSFHFPDIFNDLSVHTFHCDQLDSVPTNFWETPEPVYVTESELITY